MDQASQRTKNRRRTFNEVTKSSERLETIDRIREMMTLKTLKTVFLRKVGKVRNSSRTRKSNKGEVTSDCYSPRLKEHSCLQLGHICQIYGSRQKTELVYLWALGLGGYADVRLCKQFPYLTSLCSLPWGF